VSHAQDVTNNFLKKHN